jgi:hypothetical protein
MEWWVPVLSKERAEWIPDGVSVVEKGDMLQLHVLREQQDPGVSGPKTFT